jgi:predicted permease
LPTGNGSGQVGVTGPDIAAYKRNTHAFASLGTYQYIWPLQLAVDGATTPLEACPMDASMFPTLGISPLMGRVFTQQEIDDNQLVVVLSYSVWKKLFNGDPKILGRKIILNRNPYIVIGVMPRNFKFPIRPGHIDNGGIWVPLHLTKAERTQPDWNGLVMIGRLKSGITQAQAQADANRVVQETRRGYPANMANLHISSVVRSLLDEMVAQARPLIRIFFLTVCVVLLIACANLAGLLLVRAIRRRRETAIRLALGSSAATLMRQSLMEGVVLSVGGGLLGIGLAAFALRVSLKLLPETLPRIGDIGLNWAVIAFAIFLAVGTGVVSALGPAIAAIHTNMNDALKDGGRAGGVVGGHGRVRSTLAVAQIAVAMTLLFVCGLMLRSFQKMDNVDLGFNPEHVVTAIYTLPKQKYATQADVDTFKTTLEQKLRQLPGLESFGLTSYFPEAWGGGDSGFMPFIVDGYVPPKGAGSNLATAAQVEGDYFRTIGIALQRGRLFTDADNDKSQLVVVVNRKLAEHFWPGQDPIGKRLRIGEPTDTKTPWLTVVGEVADVKQGGPDHPTSEQFYQPLAQFHASLGALRKSTELVGHQLSVLLRSPLSASLMKSSIRKVVRSIDPQLALSEVESMDEAVGQTKGPRQFNTIMVTVFASVAVLLAIMGIYGVIAFSTALRTHEMAIRMALGSSRSGIIWLVLGSAARLALIGCAIGTAGAIALSHLVRSFLFQVGPFDPVALIGAVGVILMLALAASFLPARRAASIEPMQALKSE